MSEDFFRLWNFPHCIGAFDGKHIGIQAPKNSGSEYFNYKSFFSIVLMAAVDANYKFIYADVGCQGRISDGGVIRNTSFYQDLHKQALGLPNPQPLPVTNIIAPYVFVADDAFPLEEHFMKPYSGSWEKGTKERALNYRLSRARRIVENAFGIMSSVFRVLRRPMLLEPRKASLVTLACVYLHNFLKNSRHSANIYAPPGSVDAYDENGELIEGAWRREIQDLTSFHPLQNLPRRSLEDVKKIRDTFADYCRIDRVPWQDKYE